MLYVQYGMVKIWSSTDQRVGGFDPWHLPSKCPSSLGKPLQLHCHQWLCVNGWMRGKLHSALPIIYVTLRFLNCPIVSPIVMVGSMLKHGVFFLFARLFVCLFFNSWHVVRAKLWHYAASTCKSKMYIVEESLCIHAPCRYAFALRHMPVDSMNMHENAVFVNWKDLLY